MKRVTLELHIVPSQFNLSLVEGCDLARIGKKCSTDKQIFFNKINSAISSMYGSTLYTAVFSSNIFEKLDMPGIGKSIVNILTKNISDAEIFIVIHYHYELINDEENDAFSVAAGLKVIELHMYLDKIFHNGTAMSNDNVIRYVTTDEITEIAEYIHDIYEENESEDSDDEDEEEDGETDEEEDESDAENSEEEAISELTRILKYTDDDDGKKKKKKGSRSKKYYNSSRVFKAAKNPKRAYRRHGVLVCKSKSAIKKDEKTIKEFLKDFFPGNAGWKKDFRRDVLKRWMSMYVVSYNKLKQLEKEHQKKMRKKHRKALNPDMAMDFTRRLLNVPIDTWSDPSK